MAEVEYRGFDREIWERELAEFVPAELYDMHVHLWSEAHKGELTGPPTGLRLEIDYQAQLSWAAQLYPGRRIHFLILGTPIKGMDIKGHNEWLAGQGSADPVSAVHLAVTPDMIPEHLTALVARHGCLGLKPYRVFAADPTNARIRDFLPEAQIEVAHELGLSVTLHLSRPTGPADPDNLEDLGYLTRQYPRIQWILAHGARAFNSLFLEESIHVLRDLPNLWYDTSAVNDLYSHYLLLKHDRGRVMYGSDDVVAGCARGKYITYARAWQFYAGPPQLEHCEATATLVVYEQLRQERQAALMLGLTPGEIVDHFAGNARRFLAQVRAARRR